MAIILSEIFKKNRAEEFPDDLWNTFIFPMEYEQWNLLSNKKGVHVIGGRGTGKTMFLKYHCFHTQLSKSREVITERDLESVGIYWRPDTHFVKLINQDYLENKWQSVFNTYVGLCLVMEFASFIKKLISSNYDNQTKKDILKNLVIPNALSEVLKCAPDTLYIDLVGHCRGFLYKLENWLNDPTSEIPIIIDGKASLLYMIKEFQDQNLLPNTTFHVFIDEFENLTKNQQPIVNTWLKHGVSPLIFNIAYKKYAELSIDTIGTEQLQRRNDHRIIDLVDQVYAKTDNSFKIFAAEIIANKLKDFLDKDFKDLARAIPLEDRKHLPPRRLEQYQKNMLDLANTVFPEKTYEQIANDMIADKTIFSRIQKNIEYALKFKASKLKNAQFIDINYPTETLINSVLLFRTRTKPQDLLETFNLYRSGLPSKHKEIKEYKILIENNKVGAILHLYTYFSQRICPIYSGFNRFCIMSKNNLRHLLELCYQSFTELELTIQDFKQFHKELPIVPIESQLKAAKFCSKQELETIQELGPYGQDLQKIANRLGRIFYLKQRIRTQSQPENIHFSVETIALKSIDQKIKILINEAKLWNVLKEYDATKGTTDQIATKEYMLTPILAPYYTISPRKKYKVEFTVEELKIVFLGNDERFDSFYEKLIKDWKVEDNPETIQHSLFGELF